MKIETTMGAYTTSNYSMRDFMAHMAEGNDEKAGHELSFSEHDMSGVSDWVKVGTARITVELLDFKEIQHSQLAALQAQLQKERADSQVRQNAILEAISKLTCLEWEGAQA